MLEGWKAGRLEGRTNPAKGGVHSIGQGIAQGPVSLPLAYAILLAQPFHADYRIGHRSAPSSMPGLTILLRFPDIHPHGLCHQRVREPSLLAEQSPLLFCVDQQVGRRGKLNHIPRGRSPLRGLVSTFDNNDQVQIASHTPIVRSLRTAGLLQSPSLRSGLRLTRSFAMTPYLMRLY